MSYYGCIELAGNRSVIITELRPMVADQKLGKSLSLSLSLLV